MLQFNPKDMLLAESGNDELITLGSIDSASTDYMADAINFITECDRSVNIAKRAFYKSLLECNDGDVVALTESFEDFKDGVKNIIDKFLQFIKDLFAKFIRNFNSFIGSETYLKKHKDDLDKFSSQHEFDMKGYNFTFSPNIPSMAPVEDFNGILTDIASELATEITPEQLNTLYHNQQDGLDDYYDSKRAQIIGATGSIYGSDYNNELFKVFRDGEDSKETITVTKEKVTEAYRRFDNYKKTKQDVTKLQKDIESKYKETKNRISDLGKRGSDTEGKLTVTYDLDINNVKTNKVFTDKDAITTAELIFKLQMDKIQQISDMHSLAFTAKLTALKDCFAQDKALLYKAMKRIQKRSLRETVTVIGQMGDDCCSDDCCKMSKEVDCDEPFEDCDYDDEDPIIDLSDLLNMELPDVEDYESDEPPVAPGVPADDDDEPIHGAAEKELAEASLFFEDEYGLNAMLEADVARMIGGVL